MKAWFFHDFGDLRLMETESPSSPRPGWVIVSVRVAQPSISEAIMLAGGPARHVEEMRSLVQANGPMRLLGHEYAGDVTAIGDRVDHLRVGDRVACLDPVSDEGQVGFEIPGCFAEQVEVPAATLVKLPDGIDYSGGATVQAMSYSMACVAAARIEPGDTIAVFGQGAIGLGILQIARHAGAGKVVTTAKRRISADLSLSLGADVAVCSSAEDPVERIQDLTDGRGVDVAFDAASGAAVAGLSGTATLDQAISVTRKGGRLVEGSAIAGEASIDMQKLQNRALALIYPDHRIGPKLTAYMLKLMVQGRVRMAPAITHKLPGIEKVREAFDITYNKAKFSATLAAQVVI